MCALLAAAAAALSSSGCGARTTLPEKTVSLPSSERPPVCGDHVVSGLEECDDGNVDDADACVGGCVLARCGDGHVFADVEACDAGGHASAACRDDCSLPTCGNGVVDPGEDCDDADGDDSDACPSSCLSAVCGDGHLHAGVEECDEGAENADAPAYLLTQGELARSVRPVDRAAPAAAFYAYYSASAHTGFEKVGTSSLFLYRDTTSGASSLFTLHGIDYDTTGTSQPKARVEQRFSYLPDAIVLAVQDDKPEELGKLESAAVLGAWNFADNTDGGVLAGFPASGWSIEIASDFVLGIWSWRFLEPGGETALEPTLPANLTALPSGPGCRTDCTVARCGDAILDAGEACDDGNESEGDGCAPDCSGAF